MISDKELAIKEKNGYLCTVEWSLQMTFFGFAVLGVLFIFSLPFIALIARHFLARNALPPISFIETIADEPSLELVPYKGEAKIANRPPDAAFRSGGALLLGWASLNRERRPVLTLGLQINSDSILFATFVGEELVELSLRDADDDVPVLRFANSSYRAALDRLRRSVDATRRRVSGNLS